MDTAMRDMDQIRERHPEDGPARRTTVLVLAGLVTVSLVLAMGMLMGDSEEISIGDFVLTGGELPALVMLDAVSRFVPGVIGDADSVRQDSFARGLLDFPHYTRPARVRDRQVPDVLLSGNHAAIARWRKREALKRTLERRPELLQSADLDSEERSLLRELLEQQEKHP